MGGTYNPYKDAVDLDGDGEISLEEARHGAIAIGSPMNTPAAYYAKLGRKTAEDEVLEATHQIDESAFATDWAHAQAAQAEGDQLMGRQFDPQMLSAMQQQASGGQSAAEGQFLQERGLTADAMMAASQGGLGNVGGNVRQGQYQQSQLMGQSAAPLAMLRQEQQGTAEQMFAQALMRQQAVNQQQAGYVGNLGIQQDIMGMQNRGMLEGLKMDEFYNSKAQMLDAQAQRYGLDAQRNAANWQAAGTGVNTMLGLAQAYGNNQGPQTTEQGGNLLNPAMGTANMPSSTSPGQSPVQDFGYA